MNVHKLVKARGCFEGSRQYILSCEKTNDINGISKISVCYFININFLFLLQMGLRLMDILQQPAQWLMVRYFFYFILKCWKLFWKKLICQFINSISFISTFSFFFSGESSVDGDSSSTTSHSDSQSEVAQIEHFAEQLVDQLARGRKILYGTFGWWGFSFQQWWLAMERIHRYGRSTLFSYYGLHWI